MQFRANRRPALLAVAGVVLLLAAACGGATATDDGGGATEEPMATEAPSDELDPRITQLSEWSTDFSMHSVPLGEFLSGGPPKDGIPSIDDPKFVSISEADEVMEDTEPLIVVEIDGETRGYPLGILTRHEIVNDEIGGVPVAVTFCPLCNSAIVFERKLNGVVYEFGVSGVLRNSDLVMYDRQTESWWQQFTGEAIVGELTGSVLEVVPSQVVSWADFKEAHPEGQVLSRDTGFNINYGFNPYVGYDSNEDPFLFRGEPDTRLSPIERVVAVELGGEAIAYPFSVLEEVDVVHDTVGGQNIVVFHQPGTASALDTSEIHEGRDVGAAGVFQPEAGGQELTFRSEGDQFFDNQTDSRWNILGVAVEGPLAGEELEPVEHGSHFWFAWSAFKPETAIFEG